MRERVVAGRVAKNQSLGKNLTRTKKGKESRDAKVIQRDLERWCSVSLRLYDEALAFGEIGLRSPVGTDEGK